MPKTQTSWVAKFGRCLAVAFWLFVAAPVVANDTELAADEGKTATIFAASSLIDVLGALSVDFEKATGREVILVTGASSTLARQIEAGAPADGFISAARNYAALVAKLEGQPLYDLFGNRLVVIAPSEFVGEVEVKLLPTLLDGGRLAVGDPTHVPAGIYAQQALEALDIWEDLTDQLAPASDVRGAVNFVATGAAPFGIVYKTDAQDPRVKIVAEFETDLHAPIRYWGVEVNRANVTAELFFTYIASFDGQNLLDYYGFKSVISLE